MKKLGACLLVLLLMLTAASAEIYRDAEPPEGWADRVQLRLTVFPTYANDAMLLEAGGETMLVDGGMKGWGERLARGLKDLGYDRVDYVFNTHPDPDHIDAVEYMLRNGWYTFGSFLSPFPRDYDDPNQKACVKQLDAHGIPYRQVVDGEHLTLGTVDLTVMRYNPERGNNNALSAALMVRVGDCTMLLTSDMPNSALEYLANAYGEGIRCDILKLPHHGLCYVSKKFLQTADPQVLVLTNRRQNAVAKVRDQTRRSGLPLYSHIGGPVILETDGADWYIRQDTTRPFDSWPKVKQTKTR